MPVLPTSRYHGLAVHVAPDAGGRDHAAVPARQTPGRDPNSQPYFHTVVAGETIESLAFQFLGSSEAWWQIADANPAVFPTDLPPGTVLAIPTDAAPGLILRTRTF